MPVFGFLLLDPNGPAFLPLTMLLILASAKIMAEVFERLGQPGIVGEILAGVLIGPAVLGWLAPGAFINALGDLGAMFLLFRVGLEVKSSELIKVGGTALLVACLGVAVPFVMGTGILLLWREPGLVAIFVGASMVATSVGITAQVLSAKGLLNEVSSKIILAAAVIDDVLGLLVLAMVSSISRGTFNWRDLALTAVLAIGFTMLVAQWGSRALQRITPRAEATLRVAESQFALALLLLFSLAVLAVYTGVAAIVGAFLAGLALGESTGRRVHDLSQGVSELLVPFFLVGIGLKFGLSVFADPSTAALAIVILAAALVSKFVGCGLGALRLGRTEAFRIGAGMVPRGEIGMVVAQLGLTMGIIKQPVYSVVVLMSVGTTIAAPVLIKWAYKGLPPRAPIEGEAYRLG